ncbi:MAG: hypothetical protein MMC33_008352 [Icmadophila ericetorum]|nr:hypothetical protein [Icmadophila ericetorum]
MKTQSFLLVAFAFLTSVTAQSSSVAVPAALRPKPSQCGPDVKCGREDTGPKKPPAVSLVTVTKTTTTITTVNYEETHYTAIVVTKPTTTETWCHRFTYGPPEVETVTLEETDTQTAVSVTGTRTITATITEGITDTVECTMAPASTTLLGQPSPSPAPPAGGDQKPIQPPLKTVTSFIPATSASVTSIPASGTHSATIKSYGPQYTTASFINQ